MDECPPEVDRAIVNAVVTAHADLGKRCIPMDPPIGFTRWELVSLMTWVVLQEDINYPPPNQGRRMPFMRYLEAVLVAQGHPTYKLGDMVKRALGHFKPQPWPEVNYSLG